MRIAKPMLMVTTPLGVGWALLEAARFHWWLAVLMALLIAVIAAFTWLTLRRIRAESAAKTIAADAAAPAPAENRTPSSR